jgi:PAS domain-containing protein
MRTGSRANILLSASPIRDIGGNITGGVVVIQDVTHEMELEKQAQDQAATLSTLLDTIPIGVIVADEETDAISYYSWGAVEIFWVLLPELLPTHLRAPIHSLKQMVSYSLLMSCP